jgi:hypothetical protein
MIVIITNQFDDSTSEVLEWMRGDDVLRINNDTVPQYFQSTLVDLDFSKNLPFIDSVWFRKGGYVDIDINCNNKTIIKHASHELYALSRFYYSIGPNTRTLGTTNIIRLSKLSILQSFKRHSLNIPPTLITTQKSSLISFKKQHSEVIIKPLSEGAKFEIDGQLYKLYTEKLVDSIIEGLNDDFFPTLLQKCIPKKYEIRSFILNDEVYSMALLTSKGSPDIIDLRWHQQVEEIRSVPYKLPSELQIRMIELMQSLSLDTGSFDIIKGIDDRYYFLELNVAGQFGGLSHNCNYYLEKKVASYLRNGRNI